MPAPRTRLRRATRRALAVAAVAVVVGAGAVVAMTAMPATLAIDGIRFSAAERDAALVRAERAGSGDDGVVEILRDDLALFAVAREVGASDVERPSDITGVLDEANRKRVDAASTGAVLYGPVEYDERSFYGKAITDIRQATLARLDAGAVGTDVTDAEVRDRFAAEPDAWADAATTFRLDAIVGTGAIPEDSDWTALAGRGTAAQVTWTARDLESGVTGPDVVAQLTTASDGDVIGPFSDSGGWTALRLVSRDVDAEAAFEHYRSRIRAVLVEERLDVLISRARSEQDVTLP